MSNVSILGQEQPEENPLDIAPIEINVILYEESVYAMLDRLQQEKKKGNHSVVIEEGGISFQICASDSEKLKDFAEKHGRDFI
jgi:hypothetical protein